MTTLNTNAVLSQDKNIVQNICHTLSCDSTQIESFIPLNEG